MKNRNGLPTLERLLDREYSRCIWLIYLFFKSLSEFSILDGDRSSAICLPSHTTGLHSADDKQKYCNDRPWLWFITRSCPKIFTRNLEGYHNSATWSIWNALTLIFCHEKFFQQSIWLSIIFLAIHCSFCLTFLALETPTLTLFTIHRQPKYKII